MKAVVLVSGGLDSAVCLFMAAKLHGAENVKALHIQYGQRHARETEATIGLAREADVSLCFVRVPMPWGGSALTDLNVEVPESTPAPDEIPVTYVPGRNTIFLALAQACAEAVGADEVWFGANVVDYSGYPDCRPEFMTAFEWVSRTGTKRGVEGNPLQFRTPLMFLTKKEIVLEALHLGVPIERTWSCYKGGAEPCHECASCRIRDEAIALSTQ